MSERAIILLAAGCSRRLGRPKQLLSYKAESLLQRAVKTILEVPGILPAVVIGSGKAEMLEALSPYKIEVILNDHWERGMSTSVIAGLKTMSAQHLQLDGCIFAVCDQPYLSAGLLLQLMDRQDQSGKGIVAADYGGTVGTPVLIEKKYFEELFLLEKEEGAKKLIHKYPSDVATVPFAEGGIDIDTMDDYRRLTDAD